MCSFTTSAQTDVLDVKKLFAYALDGNMRSLLSAVDTPPEVKLSVKDSAIKQKFEERFKFKKDKSDYMADKAAIESLLLIYRDYWRSSFLDNKKEKDLEKKLKKEVIKLLRKNYAPAAKLKNDADDEALKEQLKGYIESIGLHSTGYDKTGQFKDIYVWRSEKDTTYHIDINGELADVKVVFMEDFITLGWSEYATLGKLHPGGWATKEALYCVKKAYDLKSETFSVSYIAHEGRHFLDYKIFPELSGADLEYRAKLTELSKANEILYTLIEFFTNNGNYDSNNAHQIANFCVIRDMSKALFNKDFETDITAWKQLDTNQIHGTALKLLEINTENLKKEGKDVKYYIKSSNDSYK